MAAFVSADWLEPRLDSASILVLDVRRPMRYLQGHLKNAVNLPVARLMDAEGRLLDEPALARALSAAGLSDSVTPVVYDAHDGRNAALLAWVLEYLGRRDVRVLDLFYEGWRAQGREVFYRPVARPEATFVARLDRSVRVMADEILAGAGGRPVDFRSPTEFSGQDQQDGAAGHLPGAINLAWDRLLGRPSEPFFDPERIKACAQSAGIVASDPLTAYCQMGPRAALGYLLLSQIGHRVRLFDGSYAEWTRRGLPVERERRGPPARPLPST